MSNEGDPPRRSNGHPNLKPKPSSAAATTTTSAPPFNVNASATPSRTSSAATSNTTSTTSSGLHQPPAAPRNTPSRSAALANSTIEQLVAHLTLFPQPDNITHLRRLAAHYDDQIHLLEARLCAGYGFGLGRTASSGSVVSASTVSGGGSGRASLDLLVNVQQADAATVAGAVAGGGMLSRAGSGSGTGTISGRSSEEPPPLTAPGAGRWTRQVFEAEGARLRAIRAKIEELLRLAAESGNGGGRRSIASGLSESRRNAVAFKRGMEVLLLMLGRTV